MQKTLEPLLQAIDEAIEEEDQIRALKLVVANWYHLSEPAPLRERAAMILATAGRKREAVEIYSLVARHYANAGQPMRSLAAIKQMQALNPTSTQLLDHFTTLYSVRSPFLERGLKESTVTAPSESPRLDVHDGGDRDGLFAKVVELATSRDGTAERPGALPPLPLLSLLPPKALRRLLDVLEYEIYAESQPVVSPDQSEGERDLFWTISADFTAIDKEEIFTVPPGTLLGLSAFRTDPPPANHTVMSHRGSECLRLSRTDVELLTDEFADLPNRLATLYRHALTQRLFQRHPMFAQLDDRAIEAFPSHLIGLRLDDATILLKQGKVSPGLYILLDGLAEVHRETKDEAVTIDTLNPGDMIGEIGLVEPQPTIASVLTKGPAHMLFCPRDAFLEFAHDHPSVATFAEKQARRRIEQIQRALEEVQLV